MWLAVFADVGVSFLAVLNAMRTLRMSEATTQLYEKVNRSQTSGSLFLCCSMLFQQGLKCTVSHDIILLIPF
jgi:hypothetical protein